MTIKRELTLVALTCATACGSVDSTDWTDTDQNSEAIVGGRLAPNGSDPMVVKLGPCTATKIGSRRFLTAAHCGFAPGTVSLTNRSDGTGGVIHNIERVWVHPTYRNQIASQPGYDVALVDISADTPSIPVQTAMHFFHVDAGKTGALTGYGKDPLDPSHDGRKQYEFFTTALPANAPAAVTIPFFYEPAGGFAVHCGDDGGPFFIKTGAIWRLAGVAREPVGVNCAATPPVLGTRESWFTRVDNVRGWLQNPIENDFSGDGFLLNRSNNRCLDHALRVTTCDGQTQLSPPESHPIEDQNWRAEASLDTYRFRSSHNTCFMPHPLLGLVFLGACDTGRHVFWAPVTQAGTPFVWLKSTTRGTCLSLGGAGGVQPSHEPCNFTSGAAPSQNWLFVH